MTPKKKLIEVALPNLAFLVSKLADKGSTICTWDVGPTSSRTASGRSARVATVRVTFARQGIPMTWDFAEGKPLSVREALALINQTLDEALAKQEGDFDAGSRWALAWFEQSGFEAGEYGVAETLSKAKNTSVAGMVEASVLASKGGKVRLLRPDELPADWDPETEPRLTAWESVHHLVRALEAGGENAAADLVARSAARLKSPANWPIDFTPYADARNARRKRFRTTASCKAGPKLRAWRAKAVSRSGLNPNYSIRSNQMAINNHERVGKAMELLKQGLGPFVERE
jgi:adenine-specific DNA methylase